MKMIKVFLLIFALINTTYAAKITDPVLHVGKQAGNDFTILHKDGGYIKKAGSQGDWFFSKDGVLEKKIGSGTGGSGDGGVNILANNSFEDGLTDWTTSGGTLTQQTYTNSIESNTKYARFVSTTPGEYVESSCIARPDNFTYGGMADIRYLGGSGNFELKVFDCSSGDTEISSSTLADLTEWNKSPTQTFTAPANLKIRIISTGAGTIDFDLAYGGSDKNFGPASGGRELAFEAYYPITTGCQWSVSGTGGYLSFADFPVDTDCAAPIARVEKNGMTLDTTDADLPQFTINNMPPGKYEIEVTGLTIVGLQLQEAGIALFENTTATDFYKDAYVSRNSSASENEQFTFNTEFTNPSLATRVFKVRGGNGSGGVQLNVNSGQGRELQIKIYRLTGEVVDGFTPEQSSFFYKGYIYTPSGTSNIPNGTDQYLSRSDMTLANVQGSAKIGCSAAASTGATCSGSNEISAINLNLPVAGIYRVCVNYSGRASSMSNLTTFGIVEKEIASDTVLQRGLNVWQAYSNTAQEVSNSNYYCERFSIATVGEKSFGIKYSKSSGSLNWNMFQNASTTSTDQSNYVMTVELVSNYVARPVIQNMVETGAKTGVKIGTCMIQNSGGVPSFDTSDPDCWFISSVGDVSTGVYQITTDTTGYKCNCSQTDTGNCSFASNAGGHMGAVSSFPNPFRIYVYTSNGGSLDDKTVSLSCSKNR